MWNERDPVQPRDFGVAAVLCLPFLLVLGALPLVMAPTSAQRTAADPLVQLLGGAWPVVPITVAIVAAWLVRSRPRVHPLRRGMLHAGAGATAAACVALAIFAVVGDTLPSFIPPEESARAGLTNGVAAGLLEEAVFRLGVLPLLYALARRRLSLYPAIVVAALGTGLLFALTHELGPAGAVFDPRFLATRTLFPGLVMSLVALRLSPTFMVTAHCTAHLMIPALFV